MSDNLNDRLVSTTVSNSSRRKSQSPAFALVYREWVRAQIRFRPAGDELPVLEKGHGAEHPAVACGNQDGSNVGMQTRYPIQASKASAPSECRVLDVLQNRSDELGQSFIPGGDNSRRLQPELLAKELHPHISRSSSDQDVGDEELADNRVTPSEVKVADFETGPLGITPVRVPKSAV